MNYGFIPPKIKPEDYFLGGQTKLSAIVLCPDGQWDSYLPEREVQNKNGLETYNCTTYGTLNALEILYKRLFNKEENFSERYIGVMANTTPQGNAIENVIETIRTKSGNIPEKLLPFSEDIKHWSDYYSPKPMSEELVLIGQNWLNLYKVGHEWIFGKDDKGKIEKLKNALRFSPVGISVSAWFKDDNGFYYKPTNFEDNHWVVCYGYKEPYYWKIYDSYDNTCKKTLWNTDFGWAKRYTLEKKIITEPAKQTIWSNIKKALDLIQIKINELKVKIGKALGGLFNVK